MSDYNSSIDQCRTDFGKYLKRLRTDRKMTQASLQAATGVASTHSDPLLGVPQAGRPRQLQWLDEQGQVQRMDLGEQPLTTLRWGLYLFVPSIEGLRHIAAGPAAVPDPRPQPLTGEPYDPRSPAFDAWRRVVQDASLREFHRVLQPGGELRLVTDHDELWAWCEEHATRQCELFERLPFEPPASAAEGEVVGTNFERKYRREGRPFHAMTLRKRPSG